MDGNGHEPCERRHHEVLELLCAVSQRIANVEADQRAIVELLKDFRDLLRLVAAYVRVLDGRVDRMGPSFLPRSGQSERIARHLRN